MPGVLIAVLLLVAAPGCRQAGASKSTPAASRAALLRIGALEREVQQMHDSDSHLAGAMHKAAARVDSLRGRMARVQAWLGRLKARLHEMGGTAGAAAAHADAAAARAAQLASQLSLLEKRFDYHLKHDPGGR